MLKIPKILQVLIFKKINNYKSWAMELDSDCFIQSFIWPNNVVFLNQTAKKNGTLISLSSEVHGLSIGMKLTLSPMEIYQMSLNIV